MGLVFLTLAVLTLLVTGLTRFFRPEAMEEGRATPLSQPPEDGGPSEERKLAAAMGVAMALATQTSAPQATSTTGAPSSRGEAWKLQGREDSMRSRTVGR